MALNRITLQTLPKVLSHETPGGSLLIHNSSGQGSKILEVAKR